MFFLVQQKSADLTELRALKKTAKKVLTQLSWVFFCLV
jgi:hypothetical protein